MKFCSTCLPSCPPLSSIHAETNNKVVVSGQLVFFHQGDRTPSAGSSDAKNISK